MKHLSKWILCLLALVSVAGLSVAWTPAAAQQTGQQGEGKVRPGKAATRLPSPKGRAKKHDAIKQALPTMKTSLAEAVTLAEKETGGKAFDASVEVRDEKDVKKVLVQVSLVVGDKFSIAQVNTENKKVTLVGKKDGEEAGEAEGDASGEEEEGG